MYFFFILTEKQIVNVFLFYTSHVIFEQSDCEVWRDFLCMFHQIPLDSTWQLFEENWKLEKQFA